MDWICWIPFLFPSFHLFFFSHSPPALARPSRSLCELIAVLELIVLLTFTSPSSRYVTFNFSSPFCTSSHRPRLPSRQTPTPITKSYTPPRHKHQVPALPSPPPSTPTQKVPLDLPCQTLTRIASAPDPLQILTSNKITNAPIQVQVSVQMTQRRATTLPVALVHPLPRRRMT